RLLFQFFNRGKDRFRFQHHSLPAAKRRVIDDVMFILCPIAQVVNAKIDNPIFLRPFHHALAQRRAADFGKKGENVDLHSEETSNAQRPTSNIESIRKPTRRSRAWRAVRGAKRSYSTSREWRGSFGRCDR